MNIMDYQKTFYYTAYRNCPEKNFAGDYIGNGLMAGEFGF